MKITFKNKQKKLLCVLEKNRYEIVNLLKDVNAKISAQNKKMAELQKNIRLQKALIMELQNKDKNVADEDKCG